MTAKEKLIVALDIGTYDEAVRMVDILKDKVDIFKVGIVPFTAFGDGILRHIEEQGKKVFLDLKFHDIPNTVRNAARAGASRGVFIMNFHSLGGEEMLKAARQGAEEGSGGGKPPILLAVTILTSMNQEAVKKAGLAGTVKERVMDLAGVAAGSGMDGVVASAQEAAEIKRTQGSGFIVLTPGVRPVWASGQDQKRIMTPAMAAASGADYIVVGRPILEAEDPAKAADMVLKEIEENAQR